MFLKNAWYVAAQSESIGKGLTSLKILAEDILFYRNTHGDVVALEDACPHRKLPLSMGRLLGDTVQCGYHGLTFDCNGRCVNAPTQDKIPVNAVVRSYPIVEKYKLVWIWMGNPDLADESTIVSVEDYGNEGWALTDGGMLECRCNYLYLMDNLLDPSHVAWVHETSFASAGTEDTPLEMEETDRGMLVSRWIKNIVPPPYYLDKIKFSGKADRLQYYEAVLPSVAINMSTYTPSGSGGHNKTLPDNTYRMRSYHFLTPVNETETRYHWFQHYNTDINDEEVRVRLNEGARGAFEEDREVLEAVQLGMDNMQSRNIDLRLDAGSRLFRKKLDVLIAEESAYSE